MLRYDPRDTGLSDDGGDAYTLGDIARDIVVVAAAAGVDRFHVVALSMAGMVTVDLAVHHPSRVASIVFLGAMSPDPGAGMGSRFSDGIGADPLLGALASMASPGADDETWMRARLATALQRAPARPDAALRHQQAALRLGWPEPTDLPRIVAPTLVVHGERATSCCRSPTPRRCRPACRVPASSSSTGSGTCRTAPRVGRDRRPGDRPRGRRRRPRRLTDASRHAARRPGLTSAS